MVYVAISTALTWERYYSNLEVKMASKFQIRHSLLKSTAEVHTKYEICLNVARLRCGGTVKLHTYHWYSSVHYFVEVTLV